MLRGWWGLWRREMIANRIGLFWGPLVVVGFAVAVAGLAAANVTLWFSGEWTSSGGAGALLGTKVYEFWVLAGFGFGAAYLGISQIVITTRSFPGDWENNNILFWKSMPVSDFAITLVKFGVVAFLLPASFLAFGLLGAFGLYLAFFRLGEAFGAGLTASLFKVIKLAPVYFALASLWYMPLLAYIAAMATLLRRWWPLAAALIFFVPWALEFTGASPKAGSAIAHYLDWYFRFAHISDWLRGLVLSPHPLDVDAAIGELWARIDWRQMALGLVFTVLALWIVSEVRRRRLD